MKTLVVLTTSALVLASGAMAAETPIQEVDVQTDLTAIENPAAARHFATLGTDLQADILARLDPARLTTEGGSKIDVKIDALELASTWANVNDISQSKLTGTVSVTSETDNSKFDNYTLTVAYPEVIAILPPGTDVAALTTDSKLYYDAMIDTFAEHVVDHLK